MGKKEILDRLLRYGRRTSNKRPLLKIPYQRSSNRKARKAIMGEEAAIFSRRNRRNERGRNAMIWNEIGVLGPYINFDGACRRFQTVNERVP